MDLDDLDRKVDDFIINFFKNLFKKNKGSKEDKKKMSKGIIIGSIIGTLAFIVLLSSFTVIDGGYRGVVFSKATGVKDVILSEGFHFKTPLVDSIIQLEVRTKKFETPMGSTSYDQQIVNTIATLNYHINPDQVNKLYQEVGLDYESRVVKPVMEGTVKTVMARYKADALTQQRDKVSAEIAEELQTKLADNYITVDRFELADIDYSDKYDAAIEAKQEAEQNALKAENELKTIEVEQKQKIAKAEADKQEKILQAEANAKSTELNAEASAKAKLLTAEAEAKAIDLVNSKLDSSPKYIEYIKATKWDGVVPTTLVTSETDLLMNIK